MNYRYYIDIDTIHDVIALAMLEYPEDIPDILYVYDALIIMYDWALIGWRLTISDIATAHVGMDARHVAWGHPDVLDAMCIVTPRERREWGKTQ